MEVAETTSQAYAYREYKLAKWRSLAESITLSLKSSRRRSKASSRIRRYDYNLRKKISTKVAPWPLIFVVGRD